MDTSRRLDRRLDVRNVTPRDTPGGLIPAN